MMEMDQSSISGQMMPKVRALVLNACLLSRSGAGIAEFQTRHACELSHFD